MVQRWSAGCDKSFEARKCWSVFGYVGKLWCLKSDLAATGSLWVKPSNWRTYLLMQPSIHCTLSLSLYHYLYTVLCLIESFDIRL